MLCYLLWVWATGSSIEPKQTEDQPKQIDREHILIFLRKFRVVLVSLSLFRLFWYRFETPKQSKVFSFGYFINFHISSYFPYFEVLEVMFAVMLPYFG
jgi:hypothetical protein